MASDKRNCDRLLILICLLGLITLSSTVQADNTDPPGEDNPELAKDEACSRHESVSNLVPAEEPSRDESAEQDEVPKEEPQKKGSSTGEKRLEEVEGAGSAGETPKGRVLEGGNGRKESPQEEAIEFKEERGPEKRKLNETSPEGEEAKSAESVAPKKAVIFTLGSQSALEFSHDPLYLTEEDLESFKNSPSRPLRKKERLEPSAESEEEMARLDAELARLALEKDKEEGRVTEAEVEGWSTPPKMVGEENWKRVLSPHESDKSTSDENEPNSSESPLRLSDAQLYQQIKIPAVHIERPDRVPNLSEAFKRIDVELIKRNRALAKREPPGSDYSILKSLLAETTDLRDKERSKSKKKMLDLNLLAMRYLLSLKFVLGALQCSLISYAILSQCDRSLQGRGQKFLEHSAEEESSRVLWLVRNASEKHRTICRFKYADKFEDQLKHVDKIQLYRVKQALSKFIEPLVYAQDEDLYLSSSEDIYGQTIATSRRIPISVQKANRNVPRDKKGKLLPLAGRLWVVFVMAETVPKESRDWRRIYEGVKLLERESITRSLALVRDKSISRFLYDLRLGEMDPDNFRNSIVSYLMEPCVHYVDKMKGIFIPLEYDDRMAEKKFYRLESDRIDFYYGWAHYRICRFLIENKDKAKANIKKELKKILKRAERTGALI